MEVPSDVVRCPTSSCAAQVELHGHNDPRSVFERSNPSRALAAVHELGCGNTTEVFGGAAIPSDYRGTFSVLTRQAACLFVTQG